MLIEVIASKTQLWDINDKDYRNRVIRPKLWSEVVVQLGIILT